MPDPIRRTTTHRIFITGGASGLGKALAHQYAQNGYKVCIGDINHSRGQQTLAELKTHGNDACYLPCDVAHSADLERIKATLTKRWGGVDIVVNNAGVGGTAGPVEAVTLADWDWVLNVNLKGVVRGIKAFVPLFKQQKSGHFINIASAAGLFNPAHMSSYNAAKAGVISLSESMLHELTPHNIGTTVVCPTFFTTNLLENMKSTVAGVHANVTRLMQRSDLSAADIAHTIFNAVLNEQFMVLPHKMVQEQWQYKRVKPQEFTQMMQAKGLQLTRQSRKN